MQQRPVTSHGNRQLNSNERDGKLADLRWFSPNGNRQVVDPTTFGRPEGQAYRKDERSVVTDHNMRPPTTANGPGVRIRIEPNNRDSINSRLLEAMPYSASRTISPEENARRPYFQDMSPQDSRKSVGNYKQSVSYFPDAELQKTRNGVIPQSTPQLPGRFTDNIYLQQMDSQNEPRQIMRELRATVYEDNREREIDFAQKMADRNFSHAWIPQTESQGQQLNNLQAYELLKPKIDDFSTNYRLVNKK